VSARALECRVALVTGGGRGIGRGIVHALAASGHTVALTWRRRSDPAESVVEEVAALGGRALAVPMAVEERKSVREALERVCAALGPVAVLVNNAAIAQEKPFLDIDDADWDHMQAVNLRGPFTCCQEALPAMRAAGFGRIVNVTSIGGQWGGFNQVHYAATKAGLISLTRSLARIFSAEGITANAVAPGLVATDMAAAELDSEAGREKVRGIPAGRIGTVGDVAGAVAYLASDAAAYVTGQTLNVNGGMYFV